MAGAADPDTNHDGATNTTFPEIECRKRFLEDGNQASCRACYTPASLDEIIATPPESIADLQQRLAAAHYVADHGLAVSLFLALRLPRPLFLEGEAGVGKTALAGAMASALGTDLIRLQCYEGLDVSHAIYEWDYPRQLLELRMLDAAGTLDRASARRDLYSEAFLLKRPLLQAIDPGRARPAVLLIDEIDRADEEFEGFLLELLAEFQVTIPELGTVRAVQPPVVILTSNRTREVHDALKRRCLYQWIDYPSFEKELAIVRQRVPGASAQLAERVTAMAQELRSADLYKVPGVSETIDWVAALVALDRQTLDAQAIADTLGVVLKAKEDLEALRGRGAAALLDRALARESSSCLGPQP
jgi:MoxR-like ATPase